MPEVDFDFIVGSWRFRIVHLSFVTLLFSGMCPFGGIGQWNNLSGKKLKSSPQPLMIYYILCLTHISLRLETSNDSNSFSLEMCISCSTLRWPPIILTLQQRVAVAMFHHLVMGTIKLKKWANFHGVVDVCKILCTWSRVYGRITQAFVFKSTEGSSRSIEWCREKDNFWYLKIVCSQ